MCLLINIVNTGGGIHVEMTCECSWSAKKELELVAWEKGASLLSNLLPLP